MKHFSWGIAKVDFNRLICALLVIASWCARVAADDTAILQPALLSGGGASNDDQASYQISSPTDIRSATQARRQPTRRKLVPCECNCDYHTPLVGQIWLKAEYLAWDTKGAFLPTLLTSSPRGTPPDNAGDLGQAGTSILFGNHNVHDDVRSGGRLTVGFWCSRAQLTGLEASYFGVGGSDLASLATSDRFPIIARPFVNTTDGNSDAHLVAHPDLFSGRSLARVDFELSGAEVLTRKALRWSARHRVDLLAGYRYGRLYDRVLVDDRSVSLDAASGFAPDTIVARSDRFLSVNDFHGAELGLFSRHWHGCWSLSLLGKLAFGGVDTRLETAGRTTITEQVGHDVVTTTFPGGVLALPSNQGSRNVADTALLSELGLNLECQVRPNLRVAIGYTFLHWNEVSRAESLIDLAINPSQIPPGVSTGLPQPAPTYERTDFWAQGLNTSVEYQY